MMYSSYEIVDNKHEIMQFHNQLFIFELCLSSTHSLYFYHSDITRIIVYSQISTKRTEEYPIHQYFHFSSDNTSITMKLFSHNIRTQNWRQQL